MSIKRIDHINFVTQNMEATIHFYCELLGFNRDQKPPFANPELKDEYLYCEGINYPLLHILHADSPTDCGWFKRLATPSPLKTKEIKTGPIDHICLLMEYDDYSIIKHRLQDAALPFETACHDEMKFNQIWVLDPNGIRVELNFTDQ